MKTNPASLLTIASALALAVPCLVSCSAHVTGSAKTGPSIDGLYLSDDSKKIKIVFTEPYRSREAAPVKDMITVIHETDGIKMTCPIHSETDGYYFSNYGQILKKGDRVSVIIEGFSPAGATVE